VAEAGKDSSTSSQPAQSNAVRSLTELVHMHQAMVWRYLRALGADPTLADDITQETFLEIVRNPLQQYTDAATASYLRRVAHNLLVSKRRREGRMIVTQNAQEFEAAWTKWAGFDGGDRTLELLAECLSSLTQRARQALKLRFCDEASRAQIAQTLGVGEHGAKNLMQRAKLQIKKCLEERLERQPAP
jgi:RNA polymerase sigma-70 factor (ECF subfamily)